MARKQPVKLTDMQLSEDEEEPEALSLNIQMQINETTIQETSFDPRHDILNLQTHDAEPNVSHSGKSSEVQSILGPN